MKILQEKWKPILKMLKSHKYLGARLQWLRYGRRCVIVRCSPNGPKAATTAVWSSRALCWFWFRS